MTAGMHCSTEQLADNNNNVGIVFGFFFLELWEGQDLSLWHLLLCEEEDTV